MNKFFKSSFFILTAIAILSGSTGALLTGAWDLTPPPQGIYSYGNYIDGAKFGAFCAVLGLIPYWIFHLIIGDATNSWKNSKSKKRRIAWVVLWASFSGWFFTMSLSV